MTHHFFIKFLWNSSGILMKSHWHIHQIPLKSHWHIHQIPLKPHWISLNSWFNPKNFKLTINLTVSSHSSYWNPFEPPWNHRFFIGIPGLPQAELRQDWRRSLRRSWPPSPWAPPCAAPGWSRRRWRWWSWAMRCRQAKSAEQGRKTNQILVDDYDTLW